jgi:hypothetical protein
MRLPSEPVLNGQLTKQVETPVVMLDVIPVRPGETLRITFKSQTGDWRQGIWMGVDGQLSVGGHRADQVEIWTDTAPPSFDVEVLRSTDGLLRLYNIWDSGRGRRRESQSATSGMLKETNHGSTTYRCNDVGSQPAFDKLVFEVERL